MTMDSTVLGTELTEDATRYPLDPLTGAEIEAAAAVITGSDYATPTLKFVMIQPGRARQDRRVDVRRVTGAAAGVRDDVRRRGQADLRGGRRHRCARHRLVDADSRPLPVLPGRAHDRGGGEGREDPRWQEAMRKRGVTDFSLAMIDPWPAGYYGAQATTTTTRR